MERKCSPVVLGVPLDLGASLAGAAKGPVALREAGLMAKFTELNLEATDWGNLPIAPPNREPGDYDPRVKNLREIADVCEHLRDRVLEALESGLFPVLLGGDHSLAIGSVAGVARFYQRKQYKIGLIWLDAHTDINTCETTPSGNLHGMALAHILGIGQERLNGLAGFSPMIDPRNMVLIGIRSVDSKERANVRHSGITVFTMRDIDRQGLAAVLDQAIKIATTDTVGFHFSLDLDSCDPTIAPGVGTPVLGGLTYRESHLICETVADTDRMVSMDVVELNPLLDRARQTARLAVSLIGSAFGETLLEGR